MQQDESYDRVREALVRATETMRGQKEQIAELKEEIWHLKNAMKADDERLEAAARKAGFEYFGCDTADMLADEILRFKKQEEVNG